MNLKEKTFARVLIDFNSDIRKAKLALADKRLSAAEKLILQGHLFIRDNKNTEVIATLQGLTPSDSQFIEAHRLMVLGSAYNNLTRFNEAKEHLEKAITLFQACHSQYFSFHASFTLFWVHANLEDLEPMKLELNRMERIAPQDKKQHLKLLRSRFCCFQLSDEETSAQKALAEIDCRFEEMNEDDQTRHLVDKFIFLIQLNRLQEAKDVLESSKKYRKFSLSENYNYMKKMLDHLTLDRPLYAYEKDFEGTPVLFYQIKCVQFLEEKNLKAAQEVWLKLRVSMPGVFQEFLKYSGKRSLFSLCLEKHQHVPLRAVARTQVTYPTKLEALIGHLSQADGPVRAGHLFELIWGSPPEDKEDLKKVSRLVHLAKTKFSLEIEFRKGTYYLRRERLAKSS